MRSDLARLSEQTRAVMNRLYELRGPSILDRICGRPDQREILIRQIGESREPAALAALLSFLCGNQRALALAAGRAIQQIVVNVEPLDLAYLDRAIREDSSYDRSTPPASDLYARLRDQIGVGPLGVLSFHPGGHTREAAVRSMSKVSNGSELPFLLIRVNDWVEPVREAARSAVQDRLRPEYAACFARSLPLALRLMVQKRTDHQTIIEGVKRLLVGRDGLSLLIDLLNSPDRFTRRTALSWAADAPDVELPDLIDRALAGSDIANRVQGARLARTRLSNQVLPAMLDRLWRDRLMAIRQEALYGYIERLPAQAQAVLESALLDPRRPIRDLARFYLRESQLRNFPMYYQQQLGSTPIHLLVPALNGLGETGATSDARHILPFCVHPSSRVRAAAIAAMANLDAESHRDMLMESLADSTPAVSRAAREALEQIAATLEPDMLWNTLASSSYPHVRRHVLILISRLNRWTALGLLLRACGLPAEDATTRAVDSVRRWLLHYNDAFNKPSPQQLVTLLAILGQSVECLDRTTISELRSILAIQATL